MKASEEVKRLQSKIDSGDLSPDEPLFVLRAQDVLSSRVVREWAKHASATVCPAVRIEEALNLASLMDDWPIKQIPGCPDTRVDERVKHLPVRPENLKSVLSNVIEYEVNGKTWRRYISRDRSTQGVTLETATDLERVIWCSESGEKASDCLPGDIMNFLGMAT